MDPTNSINTHGLYTPLPIPFAPLTNLLRNMIKKNLKEWEEGLPQVEFAYNRAVHSTTNMCPLVVVYGFKPCTPLDLPPLPLQDRVNMEASTRADFMKNVHLKNRGVIDKKTHLHAKKANIHKREMLVEPKDLVWIHFRKDRFPTKRSTKLKPRGDGPFKVLKKINDNAYEIDLPSNKYALSSTFKVGQVTSNTPKGPTTRAQARRLNYEVKSLLLESRFDISESWILPHASHVCLISFAGEDVERDGDRKTKGGCCPGQTGPTALHAGPTGLVLSGSSAEFHRRSDRRKRRSDRRSWSFGVRPSQRSPRFLLSSLESCLHLLRPSSLGA